MESFHSRTLHFPSLYTRDTWGVRICEHDIGFICLFVSLFVCFIVCLFLCLFVSLFVRIYQQQLEMEKAEQLKRPTEDLEVRETSTLPSLLALGWVRLPADAFSSLLMVIEFAQSFDEFLELEPAPPILGDLYLSLYNGGGGRAMMELCAQLLKAAIYDPSKRRG